MKLKHYFVSLALVLILGLSFLPSCALATGEDEPGTSDQENKDDSQEPGDGEGDGSNGDNGEDQKPEPDDTGDSSDDTGDSSDDDSQGSFIGGGMNSDNEESKPQAPAAPSTPKPTTPVPTIPKPTLPSIVPGLSSSQTASSSRPQGTSTSSVGLATEPTDEESAEIDDAEQNLSLLPTAPSSNLAPGSVETPNTGASEPVSINIAAIALLIVAGVTIMSAGIFVTIMQKAANRDQRTL